jgi:hypothetical protein
MTQNTISHLRQLAEAANLSLTPTAAYFDIREVEAYRAATGPSVILALLKRLEAAEKVVLATRRMDVPVMADALIAYDQAIAADGDKGGK